MANKIIAEAVVALNEKLANSDGFTEAAKFEIEDEGDILVIDGVAKAADGANPDVDCTISADAETYKDIFEGNLDPAAAFMTGKLRIDGDMGSAMQLAQILA